MNIHRGVSNLPTFSNAVLTIGSFDGVHRGHQSLIKKINDLASEIEGESIIITFDPHPRKIIFPKDNSLELITTLDEKLALFEKYGVDHVVIVPFSVEFSQQHPREYVEKFLCTNFQPKYIVIGYDHRFGLHRQGDINLLRNYQDQFGFEVVEVNKQEIEDIAISSTKVRKALSEGDIRYANLLLDHRYTLTGKVIRGQQIGHKIGYPTANLHVADQDKIVPAYGIYAVEVGVGDERYGGMLYIGTKPTLPESSPTAIEVNIFDFEGDLYDQQITLHFVDYLRGDQKFDSLEALAQQLGRDQVAALAALDRYSAAPAPPRTTIAILNFNGRQYLESYLPPMLESSKEDFDLLVIDNASSDESVAYIKEWHPEVQLRILKENYGFAGGYNKGLSPVNTPYTVIINSDVLVTEGWLDPILTYMDQHPQVAAVQPKIRSLEEQEKFEYAGAAGGWIDALGYPFCRGRLFDQCEEDRGQYDTVEEVAWVSGACMVVRTEVFQQLGGFDADYFAHQEEIDFCYRMRAAGHKLVCLPQSIVYHLGGGTLDYESPRKTYLNFRNNWSTMLKNEPVGRLLWLLPLRKLLDFAAAGQMIAAGRSGNARAVWKALWSTFFDLPKTWKKRKHYQDLILQHRKGPSATAGIYKGSVVKQFFIHGRKTFDQLG